MNKKWYLTVVLICISLITSHVEHLFLCLLSIHISCFIKSISKSSVHLKRLSYLLFIHSGYKPFIWYLRCKYFLLDCGLLFISFNSIFSLNLMLLWSIQEWLHIICDHVMKDPIVISIRQKKPQKQKNKKKNTLKN